MTSTIRTLKRLGIAAVTVATIGGGVSALAPTAATAAATTQLSITPSSQTSAAGTCQSYTVTATDNGAKPTDTPTVTVTLTQNPAYAGTIAFCDTTKNTPPGSNGNPTQSPSTGTGTTAATTSRNFTTTVAQNGTVSATFGVYSSVAGGVDVRAALTSNAAVQSNVAKATFSAPSPSPSPSATPTPTRTATPTASPGRGNPTLTVRTPTIPAGTTATLVATGAANQQYQLHCYTRPSTTYFVARAGAFDAAANPATFTLALGRNTRCYLSYATGAGQDTPSVVVNVRTVLSLSTIRTGTRTYLFQGRNLPRVAGQLITLYRVDGFGNEIRTSNLVTDDSGIYRVTRTFTGIGTFQFKVRTSQTLNNAAGVSNTISVRVY
ncbi:MAG: hypothetical protein QOJ79_2902 [Actinomycetota bacterium]|jgi:hypothetical protein|nr:hypothetical protein [Actinomycetota bacterium]